MSGEDLSVPSSRVKQPSFLECLTLEYGTDNLSRNVCIYQSTSLKSQKNQDAIYTAAEAWIRS